MKRVSADRDRKGLDEIDAVHIGDESKVGRGRCNAASASHRADPEP